MLTQEPILVPCMLSPRAQKAHLSLAICRGLGARRCSEHCLVHGTGDTVAGQPHHSSSIGATQVPARCKRFAVGHRQAAPRGQAASWRHRGPAVHGIWSCARGLCKQLLCHPRYALDRA